MFSRGSEFNPRYSINSNDFDDLTPDTKGYRLGENAPDVTLSPDYAKIATEKQEKPTTEASGTIEKAIPLRLSQILNKLIKK